MAYSLARKHGDELRVDPGGLAKSRASILESIAAMTGALVDGDAGRNEAREDDFPMTASAASGASSAASAGPMVSWTEPDRVATAAQRALGCEQPSCAPHLDR